MVGWPGGANGAEGRDLGRWWVMWVCLCKAVTGGAIERVIDAGATTVVDVGRACGAGTDCAICTRTIAVILRQHRREHRGDRLERDRRSAWWAADDA